MRVGGMAAGSIGPNGLANGWSATTPLFEAFDSPFGRWVEILGRMPSCEECVKFKVQYGKWADSTTPPTSFQRLPIGFALSVGDCAEMRWEYVRSRLQANR